MYVGMEYRADDESYPEQVPQEAGEAKQEADETGGHCQEGEALNQGADERVRLRQGFQRVCACLRLPQTPQNGRIPGQKHEQRQSCTPQNRRPNFCTVSLDTTQLLECSIIALPYSETSTQSYHT